MLRKTILADVLDEARIDQVCTDKYGRRVLLQLLAPRDTAFFDQFTIAQVRLPSPHPQADWGGMGGSRLLCELQMQPVFIPAEQTADSQDDAGNTGRMVPTSKKDPAARRRELLPVVAPALVDWCTRHTDDALCGRTADVAVALLKQPDLASFLPSAEDAESAVTNLLVALADASIVARPGAKEGVEGLRASACDHYVGRKTIRRILELPTVRAAFLPRCGDLRTNFR